MPKEKELTPFDFINSITFSKNNLLKEDPENIKAYNSFVINRGLSYYKDTLMQANEVNMRPGMDKDMQYAFLLHSIGKRKRFSKWQKGKKIPEIIQLIMEHYKYSTEKAFEMCRILSDDELNELKKILTDTGGVVKRK